MKNFIIGFLLIVVVFLLFQIRKLESQLGNFKSPPKILSELEQKTLLSKKGRIAIIIDDSGYNIRDCQYLETIPNPVAISILPELAYSKIIAQCAHDSHKEVMLHLPLEPYANDEKYPDHYIIKTDMSSSEVVQRFQEALASVPFAVGVNNHMGSKATSDERLMSVIFGQMNKRGLFFVDSRVTAHSICPTLARAKQLPFAERDVFLDNQNDRDYIENQFKQLSEEALKHGFAIGIGHARELTWQIVFEQVDKLQKEGFEIVTIKSLIESK